MENYINQKLKALDGYKELLIGRKRDINYFNVIHDFLEFIGKNEILASIIIDKVIKKRDKLDREINKLKKKLIGEVEQFHKKISPAIKKKKVKDDTLEKILEDYKGYIDDRIQSSMGKGLSIYNTACSIVGRLYELGYKDITKPYVTTKEYNIEEKGKIVKKEFINDYKIAKSAKQFENAREQYKAQLDLGLLGSYDKLLTVYAVIEALQGRNAELTKDHPKNYYWQLTISEMRKIKDYNYGTQQKDNFFAREDYDYHFNRVYLVLLDYISDSLAGTPKDKEEKKQETKKEKIIVPGIKYTYENESGSPGVLEVLGYNLPIEEKRKLVVAFFYDAYKVGDEKYKTYHDFNKYLEKKGEKTIDSTYFRQAVSAINKLITKTTDNKVTVLIEKQDTQGKIKKSNFYRWNPKNY